MNMPFGESLTEDYETPFKFNGKELDTERGICYYSTEYYDPRTSIWLSVDLLAEKYPNVNPYVYCVQNPVNLVDPDGNRVIFVNGHWSRLAGMFGMSPSGPKESYWNFFSSGIINAARAFLGAKSNESNFFIDGSSDFGGDMSGSDRYEAGREYTKEHYTDLVNGLGKGETFKLVSHSEGGAYSAGIGEYLIEKGHNVEYMLNLSPDEADEYSNPKEPIVFQLHTLGDPLSLAMDVRNTDYFITLPSSGFLEDHGKTVTKSAINILTKIMDLAKNKELNDLNSGRKRGHYKLETQDATLYRSVKAE